ncbi:MAG: hypothetical protein ACP5GH_02660 [Nitrososphaeria archaeon]
MRQRGVQEIITEVGSGLNERGKGFLKLLERVLHDKVGKAVAACEDRLTRFGFDTFKQGSRGLTQKAFNPEGENKIEDQVSNVWP